MNKANVLLIGTGGVGSIVAYGLQYTRKCNLSIVVRRDYKKVIDRGYEIESVDYGTVSNWKPDNVYSSIEEAGDSNQIFDYVVLVTKNIPDVVEPERLIEPVVTVGKTTIVLIQNGFDLGEPFIKKYPNNFVLSGISYIFSHNKNGIIEQTGTDKEIISYFDNESFTKEEQTDKAQEFVAIYSNDKNDISFSPDVKWWRYQKLVYNATLNTVCALTGLDVGRLELSGVLANVSVPAMKEVVAIAKADGCDLPKGIVNEIAHSETGYFEPSMLVDVHKGNPIELEVILGNVLKSAKRLNIETPVLSLVYELLKGVQFKLKEGQGLLKVPEKRTPNHEFYSDH